MYQSPLEQLEKSSSKPSPAARRPFGIFGQQLDGPLDPTSRVQGLRHACCTSSVAVGGPNVAQGVSDLRLVPGRTERGRGWWGWGWRRWKVNHDWWMMTYEWWMMNDDWWWRCWWWSWPSLILMCIWEMNLSILSIVLVMMMVMMVIQVTATGWEPMASSQDWWGNCVLSVILSPCPFRPPVSQEVFDHLCFFLHDLISPHLLGIFVGEPPSFKYFSRSTTSAGSNGPILRAWPPPSPPAAAARSGPAAAAAHAERCSAGRRSQDMPRREHRSGGSPWRNSDHLLKGKHGKL